MQFSITSDSKNSDWSKPNFKSELTRIIPTLDSFGLILIENSL